MLWDYFNDNWNLTKIPKPNKICKAMNSKSEKRKNKKNNLEDSQNDNEDMEQLIDDSDDEDDWKPRRKKDVGRRFHRKRTIKDDFWESN